MTLTLPVFADIDECDPEDAGGLQRCDLDLGYCLNFPGSFLCYCNEGYKHVGYKCEGSFFLTLFQAFKS